MPNIELTTKELFILLRALANRPVFKKRRHLFGVIGISNKLKNAIGRDFVKINKEWLKTNPENKDLEDWLVEE